MKTLMQKFEDIMVAITFAEAGEFDTARSIVDGEDVLAAEDKTLDPTLDTA